MGVTLNHGKRMKLIIQFLSLIGVAIGLAAFIGYMADAEWLYNWKVIGMAINTSIVIIIYGMCIFFLAEESKKKY